MLPSFDMSRKKLANIEIREILEASVDEIDLEEEYLENFDLSEEMDVDRASVVYEFDCPGETITSLDEENPSEPVDIDFDEVLPPLSRIVWYPGRDNVGCSEPFGGKAKSKMKGKSPLEYFLNFFDPEILSSIVEETNRYAMQQDNTLFTNVGEMRIFFGIHLIMSYIKYPRIRMYWEAKSGLRCDVIADSMFLHRFEKIRSNLHFTDNDDIPIVSADRGDFHSF